MVLVVSVVLAIVSVIGILQVHAPAVSNQPTRAKVGEEAGARSSPSEPSSGDTGQGTGPFQHTRRFVLGTALTLGSAELCVSPRLRVDQDGWPTPFLHV